MTVYKSNKQKKKYTPEQAMAAQRGVGIALLFL